MTTHKILCQRAATVLAEYLAKDTELAVEFKTFPLERQMEFVTKFTAHFNETMSRLISIFDGPELREADAAPVPLTLVDFQTLTGRTLPIEMANRFFTPQPGMAFGTTEEFITAGREFARNIDLLHALLGLSGEVGELVDPVKKSMFYGKALDVENIREEAGDLLWYIAGPLCRALDCTLEDLARANVAKLQKRYPEKYTDQAAIARADKQ